MKRRLKALFRWRPYQCEVGHQERVLVDVMSFQATLERSCGTCGAAMEVSRPEDKSVPAPALKIWQPQEFLGVESDGPIESRSEYERLMKEQGLVEVGEHKAGNRQKHAPPAPENSAVEEHVNEMYRHGVLREPDGQPAGDAALEGITVKAKAGVEAAFSEPSTSDLTDAARSI